jgi:O-antigen/teichoic acid export membrane protein
MLLRTTLLYAPAVLLTRMSALLLLLLATRWMDKSEFGLLTLVVTVGEMTDLALTNWLRIALLRLGGRGAISKGSLFRAAAIVTMTTALGLLVAVIAAQQLVPERAMQFAIAACVYLVGGAVGRLAIITIQMQQRHAAYSVLEFLRASLQLGFAVAAMLLSAGSFLHVSLASSFGSLLAGCVAMIVGFRAAVPGSARFGYQEFFSLGVPIMVMAVAGFGLSNVERLFLMHYHDAAAVATFAAVYMLARQPLDLLANAINLGAFPEVVGRFDEEGAAAASNLLGHLVALVVSLSLPAAILLIVLVDDLIAFLLPGSYIGSYALPFTLIALGAISNILANFVYGTMIHAHKRPWLLVVSEFAGSAVAVGLAVMVIPSLAVTGTAVVVAGAAIANLVVVFVISERLTPVPLPWRAIGRAVVVTLATGAAAWLAKQPLDDLSAFFRLAAASLAGGIVFACVNATFYPQVLQQGLSRLKAQFQVH